MNEKKTIWLIGTGYMGIEYAHVLKNLDCKLVVIGRGAENCQTFFEKTNLKAIEGGLSKFLENKPAIPFAAIVASNIEFLKDLTVQLLEYGVKYILLEKPGVARVEEIHDLKNLTEQCKATVLLAYNRRFYASVIKAKELIEMDGGVSSFHFEFTEWSHAIRKMNNISSVVLHNWFLGNSTHVVDLAFYLGGLPVQLSAYVQGGIDWHPRSSVFAGAGISETGALFSYQANWEAPGRWALEILTKKHRFIFKPLEKLQVQQIGSVDLNFLELDNRLDLEYKPGLYLQTKAFVGRDLTNFVSVIDQENLITQVYKKISNY